MHSFIFCGRSHMCYVSFIHLPHLYTFLTCRPLPPVALSPFHLSHLYMPVHNYGDLSVTPVHTWLFGGESTHWEDHEEGQQTAEVETDPPRPTQRGLLGVRVRLQKTRGHLLYLL